MAILIVPVTGTAMAAEGWQFEKADKGFRFTSPGGGWEFEPWLRLQSRYSTPFDDDPRSLAALDAEDSGYELRRSRLKMDAQLGIPSLTLYSETELQGMQQLDLRVTWQPSDAFWFRIGQWKPEYNRERRDSSGGQQFVERSIVNREFTIDRQQGVMAYGRAGVGGPLDVSAWLGVFGGAGRHRFNDGGQPMKMLRLQWNPNGEVLGFSQSDLKRRPHPVGSVAVAALQNRSRYTRFSSDGGGELDGYAPGMVDQYAVEQWLLETALQWRGFSWQQEWHHKQIEDRIAGGRTHRTGFYAQGGYFLHETWPAFPEPLEFALRFATVDTDAPALDHRRELTLVGNWYFKGHDNKLTLDVSRLSVEQADGSDHGWRARAQWDVSF